MEITQDVIDTLNRTLLYQEQRSKIIARVEADKGVLTGSIIDSLITRSNVLMEQFQTLIETNGLSSQLEQTYQDLVQINNNIKSLYVIDYNKEQESVKSLSELAKSENKDVSEVAKPLAEQEQDIITQSKKMQKEDISILNDDKNINVLEKTIEKLGTSETKEEKPPTLQELAEETDLSLSDYLLSEKVSATQLATETKMSDSAQKKYTDLQTNVYKKEVNKNIRKDKLDATKDKYANKKMTHHRQKKIQKLQNKYAKSVHEYEKSKQKFCKYATKFEQGKEKNSTLLKSLGSKVFNYGKQVIESIHHKRVLQQEQKIDQKYQVERIKDALETSGYSLKELADALDKQFVPKDNSFKEMLEDIRDKTVGKKDEPLEETQEIEKEQSNDLKHDSLENIEAEGVELE